MQRTTKQINTKKYDQKERIQIISKSSTSDAGRPKVNECKTVGDRGGTARASKYLSYFVSKTHSHSRCAMETEKPCDANNKFYALFSCAAAIAAVAIIAIHYPTVGGGDGIAHSYTTTDTDIFAIILCHRLVINVFRSCFCIDGLLLLETFFIFIVSLFLFRRSGFSPMYFHRLPLSPSLSFRDKNQSTSHIAHIPDDENGIETKKESRSFVVAVIIIVDVDGNDIRHFDSILSLLSEQNGEWSERERETRAK